MGHVVGPGAHGQHDTGEAIVELSAEGEVGLSVAGSRGTDTHPDRRLGCRAAHPLAALVLPAGGEPVLEVEHEHVGRGLEPARQRRAQHPGAREVDTRRGGGGRSRPRRGVVRQSHERPRAAASASA